MNKKIILFIIFVTAAHLGFSQSEKPQPAFGITFSGFIKNDIFRDSRQTVSLREGHFLLFPRRGQPDKSGQDIFAKPNFNMLSIQTRLMGKITGPDALGAKTSGLIEGEFFGTSDGDINGFRLRHAVIKLNWKTTELMVGQFWHPMFITDCFPDVISFNTGAPFQPFSRAPQIRLTQIVGELSLIATALSQRDFASNGPEGVSSVYFRNAAVPEFNLKVQYSAKNESSKVETLIGMGADVLKIVPRLVTDAGYKTNQSVCGAALMAYLKHKTPKWTFKAEGVYGQNLHHLTMIGGYGPKSGITPIQEDPGYATLNTMSFWAEIQTNGQRWQAGAFGGYSKNLGARHALAGPVYTRGADIRDVYRISPRLIFNSGKLRLAAEVELTSAAYGTADLKGKVQKARSISNTRLLLATYYFF